MEIYPEFAFPKYFALFETLPIEQESLIVNRNLIAGTGLDKILGDIYIYWYSWSTNCHCGFKPYT